LTLAKAGNLTPRNLHRVGFQLRNAMRRRPRAKVVIEDEDAFRAAKDITTMLPQGNPTQKVQLGSKGHAMRVKT
jgi:hypothetical protein